MKYCSKCGAQLRENARFCDGCGTAVRTQSPAGPPAPVAETEPPPAINLLEGMQTQNAATPLLVCRRSAFTYLLQPLPWLLWLAIAASIVATVFWPQAWYAIPVTVVIYLITLLIWWIDRRGDFLTIYPDRIVRREGILNRTEVVNPIWRIQDVKMKQMWYGFGWVYIETAGEDSDQGFGPTRDAAHIRDVIYHLLRPHGRID